VGYRRDWHRGLYFDGIVAETFGLVCLIGIPV
jgi:hypothetical protein